MKLLEAVQNGTRLEVLECIRDHIAETLDNGANPKDVAALTKRLMEVIAEIDLVVATDNPDDIDTVFDGL